MSLVRLGRLGRKGGSGGREEVRKKIKRILFSFQKRKAKKSESRKEKKMLEKKSKENSFTSFLFHFRLCIFSLYVPYSLSLYSLSLCIEERANTWRKNAKVESGGHFWGVNGGPLSRRHKGGILLQKLKILIPF